LLALILGTPLAQLLAWVPVWNRLSLSRLLYLVPFVGGVLAALTMETLSSGGKVLERVRFATVFCAGAALAGLLLAAILQARLSKHGILPGWYTQWWLAVGWLLAAAVVGYCSTLSVASRPVWVASLPVLLAGNLLAAQCQYNPAVPTGWAYPDRPILRALREAAGGGRIIALQGEVRLAIGPGVAPAIGIAEAGGYSSLTLQAYREYLDTIGDRLRHPAARANPHLVAFSNYHPRLMDLLHVRAVVAAEPLPATATAGLRPVARGDGLAVYENPRALPRVFLVPRAEVIPDRDARLARLADPTFDPARTVLLEEAVEGEGGPEGEREWAREGAAIVRDSLHAVTIDVQAPSPRYLVMSDTHYPGWQATLDGRRVPLMRANHTFRAVAVPAGRHRVEMVFLPGSVTLGLALSALAALCLMLAMAYGSPLLTRSFHGAESTVRRAGLAVPQGRRPSA
jgi:hypothetical protein